MISQNTIFDCLGNINLIIDHHIPDPLVDAIVDGINFGIIHMFEIMPTINIKYIEDYNLTHDAIGKMNAMHRINDEKTRDIFNIMDTNVYVGYQAQPTTAGTCSVSYFTYPPIRMINLAVWGVHAWPINPQDSLRQTAAHEILHTHPIYAGPHAHCTNPDCIMFRSVYPNSPQYPSLCPQCQQKIERFNCDFAFRRKITNRAMRYDIYRTIVKQYLKICILEKSDPLTSIRLANEYSRFLLKRIKLYYRELWLGRHM